MKPGVLFATSLVATLIVLATGVAFAAGAAGPAKAKPISVDDSASFLIDPATAEKIWVENTPARVTKLYPRKKFRFVSEVTGGFNEARSCVVAARAMLLPVVTLPVQGQKLVYAPIKSATAFDAVPALTREQCQELARAKLKEAIHSVAASLAAS